MGSTSLWTASGAGVGPRDLDLRDGGRGLGFDRREEASRSVSVGTFGLRGVTGNGRPFAFPRPLLIVIGGGVSGGLSVGGGVLDGGNGLLDIRSPALVVRAFFRRGQS